MNVTVLGLGYIGLPTAAMLACTGHRVSGVDVNAMLLEDILSGCRHVSELDVRALARSALASGNFTVSCTVPHDSEAYIICVPTPTVSRKPDLHYVEQAIAAVAEAAGDGALIVLESTVPPGTVDNLVVPALERCGKDPNRLHIAHCPERVIPGAILNELRHNARVIGGRRAEDASKARDLYATFCLGELCLTDCTTAELVKVVENTYRDINLAFANELALLSEALGVDVWEVIALANKHPRVDVLRPGPGVGGHCIPVDPTFLAEANPFVTELIQTARRVNERMPHVVVKLVDEMLGTSPEAKIVLLGAAYKADVDDTRESPSEAVARLLLERRRAIAVYDPLVRSFPYPLSPSLESAAAGADLLILITDHQVFREIHPLTIAPLMRRKLVVDARNALDRNQWSAAGFSVRTLGIAAPVRPAAVAHSA